MFNQGFKILTRSALTSILILPICGKHAFADEERGLLARNIISDSLAEETGLDVSGFISGGSTLNTNHSNGYNGPVSFNDRANEVQMDQLYLSLKRSVADEGLSLGGKVDLLYGPDAVFTTSAGFDNRFTNNNTSEYYKLAIPQAYLELQTGIGNGLSIKAGHFYTLIGYETVPAAENFFYSHAYTMQYGEPFTHWGALASYKLSDQVVVTGGAVRGWDNLNDPSDGNLSFLGSVGITPSEDTSLTFALVSGNEGIGTQRTAYSVVWVQSLSESLKWIAQHDLGYQENSESTGSQWYGLNNYLVYNISEMLDIGARVEWFRDDDGVRVVGVRSGAGGVPADYFATSLAANVKFCDYFMLRPEIRGDLQNRRKGATDKAFNNGKDDYQVLLGLNAIVKF